MIAVLNVWIASLFISVFQPTTAHGEV